MKRESEVEKEKREIKKKKHKENRAIVNREGWKEVKENVKSLGLCRSSAYNVLIM